MKAFIILPAVLLMAQVTPTPAPSPSAPLAPSEIVAAAPAGDWIAVPTDDLLVMDLAPGANGAARRVVIQLMPAPFSQGWIGNIRKLAAAHWWDGTSVNRVQDNYVAQWGDADGEDKAKAKPLPAKLNTMTQADYTVSYQSAMFNHVWSWSGRTDATEKLIPRPSAAPGWTGFDDPYANQFSFAAGFPVALTRIPQSMGEDTSASTFPRGATYLVPKQVWPVHCYGMVGVGRNLSPDTGSGAELYTVIGHAPRHLDRNIALVGRVVEGIEHLSSLPRGTEALGFYKSAAERTPILRVRMAGELPVSEQPRFEYLSTESATFARYADARANRRDAFFIRPAGGADICNVPVPVRRVK